MHYVQHNVHNDVQGWTTDGPFRGREAGGGLSAHDDRGCLSPSASAPVSVLNTDQLAEPANIQALLPLLPQAKGHTLADD